MSMEKLFSCCCTSMQSLQVVKPMYLKLLLRMRDGCLKRYEISFFFFFCKETMLTSTGTVSSLAAMTLVEQPSLGHAASYTTFPPIHPPFQSTPATSPSSKGFTLALLSTKDKPHLQFFPLSGQRKLSSTLFGESGASIRGSEQKDLPYFQLQYRGALDLH